MSIKNILLDNSYIEMYLEENFISSRSVVKRLNSSNISWAFFAGVAATVYGVKRRVDDLDVMFPVAQREKISSIFTDFHRVQKEDSPFVVSKGNIELIYGKLTFLFDKTKYRFEFDEEMIERRASLEWKKMILYFLSLEDTIVLKTILQRENEHGKFDIEDIMTMLEANKSVDIDYIIFRIRKCNATRRSSFVLDILKNYSL